MLVGQFLFNGWSDLSYDINIAFKMKTKNFVVHRLNQNISGIPTTPLKIPLQLQLMCSQFSDESSCSS